MKQSLVFLAALLLPMLVIGQKQVASYAMYETVYMTPKQGVKAQLTANMSAHNKKYHAKAPNEARIWSVINGKRAGQLVWVMGPTTWTAQDTRPGEGEHDADWEKNVQSLMESTGNVEYWKLNADLSYFPNKTLTLAKSRARIITLNPSELQHYKDLRKKIKEVYLAKKLPNPVGVYENQLSSSPAGRQIAVVHFFDKWAWLDIELEFPKLYEEVHGTGSWAQFLKENSDAVQSTDEELRELIPEMSGSSTTITMPVGN